MEAIEEEETKIDYDVLPQILEIKPKQSDVSHKTYPKKGKTLTWNGKIKGNRRLKAFACFKGIKLYGDEDSPSPGFVNKVRFEKVNTKSSVLRHQDTKESEMLK